mmetsp:Transcript_31697/g.74040  ORF Transcript_31697/g.74040 Transcript_31697/m.74040 type:complete len:201 (-) Transcript_31697:1834-2436(-)
MKWPCATTGMDLPPPRSKRPSIKRSLVTLCLASLYLAQICRAVSPSQFRESKSAPASTSSCTTSLLPLATACIKAVQPRPPAEFTCAPRSIKVAVASGSSSTAAHCRALNPSSSFAATFAPAITREGRRCQWPSRDDTMRAVTPSLSTWLISTGGMANSGWSPSLFCNMRFTRSRCPEAHACIKTLLPCTSTASALAAAP